MTLVVLIISGESCITKCRRSGICIGIMWCSGCDALSCFTYSRVVKRLIGGGEFCQTIMPEAVMIQLLLP